VPTVHGSTCLHGVCFLRYHNRYMYASILVVPMKCTTRTPPPKLITQPHYFSTFPSRRRAVFHCLCPADHCNSLPPQRIALLSFPCINRAPSINEHGSRPLTINTKERRRSSSTTDSSGDVKPKYVKRCDGGAPHRLLLASINVSTDKLGKSATILVGPCSR
jgi:hypothetical protein